MKDQELGDAFNQYFVAKKFDPNSRPTDDITTPRNKNTVCLAPTDSAEVCSVYLNLKNSRSSDVDDLQIRPNKYVIYEIAPILVYVYNLCISCGTFPDRIKTARVTPIFKKKVTNKM